VGLLPTRETFDTALEPRHLLERELRYTIWAARREGERRALGQCGWWRGRRWTVQLVHVPPVYLGGTGAASAASVSSSETVIKP
jgi:hypothetical protein